MVHSLCVTLNKLGDQHYRSGDLPSAMSKYTEALALRKAVWRLERGSQSPTTPETAGISPPQTVAEQSGVTTSAGGVITVQTAPHPQLAVDVAVSAAKVADIVRVLGGEGSGKLAACGFQEALDVLQSVDQSACDDRLAAKVRQHSSVNARQSQECTLCDVQMICWQVPGS